MAIIAGVVAIAVIAAGCGSSSDSSSGGSDATTASAPMTKKQFYKEANAICAGTNQAIGEELEVVVKRVEKENGRMETPAIQTEVATDIVLPNMKIQGEELAALGGPAGEEELLTPLAEGIAKAVKEGEEDPSSSFEESSNPFLGTAKLAQKNGLEGCGTI